MNAGFPRASEPAISQGSSTAATIRRSGLTPEQVERRNRAVAGRPPLPVQQPARSEREEPGANPLANGIRVYPHSAKDPDGGGVAALVTVVAKDAAFDRPDDVTSKVFRVKKDAGTARVISDWRIGSSYWLRLLVANRVQITSEDVTSAVAKATGCDVTCVEFEAVSCNAQVSS